MAIGREVLGYENRAKLITARITGGGAAPVLASKTSKGVKSVARSATGKLLVTLERPYKRVLHVSATVVLTSGLVTTIADLAQVDATNISSAGTLIVYTSAATIGTLADLASTREIHVKLLVSDSDV